MVSKASIIEIYTRADAAGRVDIICKNYSIFIGIVDGYTEGLRYMIESEKAYNRKKNHGDLGVRVQTSGIHSDITADTAISNVITRDAIIACDFSGDVLEGVDRSEKYQRDAYTLRRMRADYELFNQQLSRWQMWQQIFLRFIFRFLIKQKRNCINSMLKYILRN